MFRIIVGALFCCLLFVTPSNATQRVALVIGIGKYKTLSKLNNPVSDAKAIAQILRVNDFHVFEYEDLTRADFLDAIESFRNEASKADVALIYYAGHGLEVGGRNNVAPTDMEFSCEAKQVSRAVELDRLFEVVQNTPQQIVLLDACRNDPFPSCDRGSGGGGFRGFERINISRNNRALLVNSTLSGRLANDGPAGGHSPFAAELLAHLKSTPNAPLRDVLDAVARDVALKTDGGQTPEVITRGGAPDVCLAESKCGGSSAIEKAPDSAVSGQGTGTVMGSTCSATDADLAFQDAIRKNTLEAYRDFLSRCRGDRRTETVLGLYGRIGDEQAWQSASGKNTLSGYLEYEALFPKGNYIELAKKRENELRVASLVPAALPGASQPPPAAPPRQVSYYQNKDLDGGQDLSGWAKGYSLETCAEACRLDQNCKAFTFNTQKNMCLLKASYGNMVTYRNAVSGLVGDTGATTSKDAADTMELREGVDYKDGDLSDIRNVSLEACKRMCAGDLRCLGFSYVKPKSWCWLKKEIGITQRNADVVSARKN